MKAGKYRTGKGARFIRKGGEWGQFQGEKKEANMGPGGCSPTERKHCEKELELSKIKKSMKEMKKDEQRGAGKGEGRGRLRLDEEKQAQIGSSAKLNRGKNKIGRKTSRNGENRSGRRWGREAEKVGQRGKRRPTRWGGERDEKEIRVRRKWRKWSKVGEGEMGDVSRIQGRNLATRVRRGIMAKSRRSSMKEMLNER